ncbi:SET domain-containing protein [Coleofasciculus sp. F4-SAH-05]|uniref:SET domain-containing protein n=1 Tax=Coleofasciculus sp. F4-SAH-05 TaxID=3069525 RepID=UPI003302570C
MTTPSLDYTITHRFPGLDLSDREFETLIELASWQRIPEFPRRGRMAWHKLNEPAALVANPNYKLRAAKLKGVGAWNPPDTSRHRDPLLDSFTETPIPPTTKPLESFATYPHFGFNSEGDYTFVYSDPAPVGGILHSRALLEYRSAEILVENGVPTIVPVAVIQYAENYRFLGKPMGAVISLVPDTAPYRLSEVQFGSATQRGTNPGADNYYNRIRESLGIEGDPTCETTRLETINILARKIGKSMRDFTLAGLYRYSPEWSNFEYDFQRQEVLFTDLDSTRQMAEIPEELRTLQALRELGSVVYRTVAKFGTPSVLEIYTLNNLLKYDPLFELISGYFPQATTAEIKTITNKLWNCFIPYLFLLKKYKQEINQDWSSERRRSYKMDHDLFYILAMTSLYPLFHQSDIFHQYPSNLTLENLIQKAELYLGERYEYFLYLFDEKTSIV